MFKKKPLTLSLIKGMIIFISAILFTACGQSYTPVKTNVPQTWATPDALYTNTDNNLPYLAWWKTFNDPTLNQFMERGLAQNNHIHIAMANVEAAQGELKRVQLDWLPGLSTNVGYSSFPDLGFPGVLFAVIPSYTINLFGQVKEQKKAEYELQAVKANRDAVKLAVIGQIATSYFSFSAQTEQLALFQQLDSDLTQLVTISDAIYQGGLTSQIDLEKAKRELSLIKAQEHVVQDNMVKSQNALRYLLNENPQKIALTRHFSELNGNQMIIGSLPLTVIENRPDMIHAANELKASNENIGLAFSNLLPTVQLSMARGEIATEPNGGTFGTSIDFNQALLQVPLFQASVYGQMDKAKGLNKASYYRYTDTLRNVMREVNNDLSAHDLYTQRFEDITEAKNHEQRVYNLNEQLYKRGIKSYMALLESKIQLDSLAIEVNQSKLEQFITITNLYQALGGGYQYSTTIEKNASVHNHDNHRNAK